MNDKPKYNPHIHHRRSIRLKGYDYSQAGLYFITICCQNRACLFGEITVGANCIRPNDKMANCVRPNDNRPKMILNKYGVIARNEWMKTPEIRNNVELGEFVIMPNHMHGIIRLLGRGELYSPDNDGELNTLHSPDNVIETMGECNSPLRGPSNNIGAIVRGYKSSVTKQLNLLNIGCSVWQRNYHEHIIRDEQSYQRISDYIINNPAKWNDDKFYTL